MRRNNITDEDLFGVPELDELPEDVLIVENGEENNE